MKKALCCLLLVGCAGADELGEAQQPLTVSVVSLHALSGSNDGSHPRASLVDVFGYLYGTTWEYGPNGYSDANGSCGSNFYAGTSIQRDKCPGTVFKVAESGSTFQVIHAFTQSDPSLERNLDGAQPVSPLTLGPDGFLYGTARSGGCPVSHGSMPVSCPTTGTIKGCGTAFKLLLGGNQFTTVHDFCSQASFADGASPNGGLLSTGGAYYAVGHAGGLYGTGVITRWDGVSWTNLFTFDALDHSVSPATNKLGATPYGAPVLGADGRLYGFTVWGGSNGRGTIYRMDPSTPSSFEVLYHFPSYTFSGNTDDAPLQSLVLASNGALYAANEFGGANGTGILFKVQGKTVTILHEFDVYSALVTPRFSNANGSLPLSTLVEGKNPDGTSDGWLYGTTSSGGLYGQGTIFRILLNGNGYEVIYHFQAPGPSYPYSGLVQGTDGRMYGTTFAGGSGYGTVYAFNPH